MTYSTEGAPPGSLKRTVRRHEMVSDDGPTWCKLCGTFDVYCFTADGEMTECFPKPESDRWWLPNTQSAATEARKDNNG